MTHVGRSYCESTSQSHCWPKTSGGQLCCGGYGKSLGVGGKMPLMSLCGPEKHADYSIRSDQRSFCKQPSAALWTPPTVGRKTKCLLERKSSYVRLWWCWWHHFWEELIWTWEAFTWVIHFTKDALHLCRRNVFEDRNNKMTPTNHCWSQSRRHLWFV